jgi:putative hydrolase of HD superfamily
MPERINTADFLYEVGVLKRTTRTGWALARLANRESVADHAFRTAVIPMAPAAMAGADPDRAAALALLYDLPEARLGDMHHLTRRYLDEPKPFRRVIDDQTAGLPAAVRDVIRDRAAEERARAAGCLFVEVNSSNHRQSAHLSYESLGFTDSRETSRRFVLPLRGA